MPVAKVKCFHCSKEAGPRSKVFCDYHLGWHAGYHSITQRAKRENDPALREAEKAAVKLRMRRLRAERRGYLNA
jgi:hypothetical protein